MEIWPAVLRPNVLDLALNLSFHCGTLALHSLKFNVLPLNDLNIFYSAMLKTQSKTIPQTKPKTQKTTKEMNKIPPPPPSLLK